MQFLVVVVPLPFGLSSYAECKFCFCYCFAYWLIEFACSKITKWNNYYYLYRFVGVGEASFISLAAPFIDDNAPHTQVSSFWFALLIDPNAPFLISDYYYYFFRKLPGLDCFTCVYQVVLLWVMSMADT